MKRIDEKRSGQAIYKEFVYIILHIWIDLTSVFRSSIHVKLKVSNGRSMSFCSFSLSIMAKCQRRNFAEISFALSIIKTSSHQI